MTTQKPIFLFADLPSGDLPIPEEARAAFKEGGPDALGRWHGVSRDPSSPGALMPGYESACGDDECLVCGLVACPLGEPMHYHHDGCPACSLEEDGR